MSSVNVLSLPSVAVCALSADITHHRTCLLSHKVKFYDCKTELIVIDTRQKLPKGDISSVRVGSFDIVLLTSVRNLGAWFDVKVAMNERLYKTCWF